ncbi:ABC transporter permease [Kibdelosporangium aridum]|uniref:NitT/TauT family transport system permease protein n=1 Tax=Kibdelosporangium aridum TaxID=2030 RepID=A0A1W2FXH2_KIBAR|nr:ABC transporter permease subunit [Kibdelosporangium aridum]SMD26346.1 NitT/TauT family transport system permease protein [Kibdelosporangium aridum]
MRSPIRSVFGLVVLLAIWEGLSATGVLDRDVVPPPSEVATQFVVLLGSASFAVAAVSTLLSWLIAITLAALIAIPLGLVLGTVRSLRTFTGVAVEFLRPLPAVALVPLVTLLVGSGAATKITVAAFAALWPIMLNTRHAVGEIDPARRDVARAFGTSRRWMLAGVVLPSIAPFVLTGIRLSAAVALVVVVSTEYVVGGGIGIGQLVAVSGRGAGRMDIVLAGAAFTGLVGQLANVGIIAAQRKWLHWAPAGGSV